MATNETSGNDVPAARTAAKAASLAKTGGKVQNVRQGKARVGMQANLGEIVELPAVTKRDRDG